MRGEKYRELCIDAGIPLGGTTPSFYLVIDALSEGKEIREEPFRTQASQRINKRRQFLGDFVISRECLKYSSEREAERVLKAFYLFKLHDSHLSLLGEVPEDSEDVEMQAQGASTMCYGTSHPKTKADIVERLGCLESSILEQLDRSSGKTHSERIKNLDSLGQIVIMGSAKLYSQYADLIGSPYKDVAKMYSGFARIARLHMENPQTGDMLLKLDTSNRQVREALSNSRKMSIGRESEDIENWKALCELVESSMSDRSVRYS